MFSSIAFCNTFFFLFILTSYFFIYTRSRDGESSSPDLEIPDCRVVPASPQELSSPDDSRPCSSMSGLSTVVNPPDSSAGDISLPPSRPESSVSNVPEEQGAPHPQENPESDDDNAESTETMSEQGTRTKSRKRDRDDNGGRGSNTL